MRSRTSFCNGTVLKKDLTRFAPVWGLYAVFLLLVLLVDQDRDPAWVAYDVRGFAEGMGVLNMLYAGICANVLFGDLFSPRMCNAMHAMPLRREGWFFTHVVAGLLFCLIPGVAAGAVVAVLCQEYFVVALLWPAVMVLEFLFFFGVGAFSVQCAGSRLGMAGVYLILNLFAGLVYVVADQLYEPLLYGVDLNSEIYKFLCPVVWLSDCDLINFAIQHPSDVGVFKGIYMEGWIYLAVVAVIGLGFLALAVALYRKRHLEIAGDLIAWKPLKPVFQVIFTIACGMLTYLMNELFGMDASFVLVAVGMVVGFFVCRMLMERTVRVFRWKNILAFVVFSLVFGASLLVTKLDPLDVTRYVPETADVEFVRLCHGDDSYVYRKDEFMLLQAETPEEVEKIRNIHAKLLTENHDKSDSVSGVEILYLLKNGREVRRYYSIDEHTVVYDELRMYFSSPEYLFNTDRWEDLVAGIEYINISVQDAEDYFDGEVKDREQIGALITALRADCLAGTMAQGFTFHAGEKQAGWLSISYDTPPVYSEIGTELAILPAYLAIYPSNTHTIACLEEIWESDLAN